MYTISKFVTLDMEVHLTCGEWNLYLKVMKFQNHDLGCSIAFYERHPNHLSFSEYLYRTFDCSEYEKMVISP